MKTTVTLFRPVGPVELELIEELDYRGFPPRLPEQPIFYPGLNEEYAVQIARDWNVKDSGSGNRRVTSDFIGAIKPPAIIPNLDQPSL